MQRRDGGSLSKDVYGALAIFSRDKIRHFIRTCILSPWVVPSFLSNRSSTCLKTQPQACYSPDNTQFKSLPSDYLFHLPNSCYDSTQFMWWSSCVTADTSRKCAEVHYLLPIYFFASLMVEFVSFMCKNSQSSVKLNLHHDSVISVKYP